MDNPNPDNAEGINAYAASMAVVADRLAAGSQRVAEAFNKWAAQIVEQVRASRQRPT